MRILHLSDSHLGQHLRSWRAPVGWSHEQDLLEGLRAGLALATSQAVDLIIHSGDLFDRKRPLPVTISAARDLFREASSQTPTLLIPGNHDRGALGAMRGIPGLTVIEEAEQLQVGELRVAALPFERDRDHWMQRALDVLPGSDIVVAHQSFHGARVPGFTFYDHRSDTIGERHLPPGEQPILCGHIHLRQVLELGGRTILHPGSTARTSSGEGDAPKCALVVEVGSELKWRFHALPDFPFHHVRSPRDLADLPHGARVHLSRDHAPEWAEVVLERGGWFVVRRPKRLPRESARQPGLFDDARAEGPSDSASETD